MRLFLLMYWEATGMRPYGKLAVESKRNNVVGLTYVLKGSQVSHGWVFSMDGDLMRVFKEIFVGGN